MKILIAGGAGYIGSVLAPVLIDHGYEVEVIDLLWFGTHLPKEVKVIKKELFECKEEDFVGYDQVIFLAGLSNDPMAEFNPAKNFIDNGALPSYLAYKAKNAGVKRFIYASSCSVYGYTVDRLYDEESPAVSNYPYGISKLQGERGVLQMQDEKFSVIAIRQGTISGFSPRMRFDLVINTMFKTAVNVQDIRNYKVTIDKAKTYLGFQPLYAINDIIDNLFDNISSFGDFEKDEFYNIRTFKKLQF